jgi:chemotaxis signal transduction protein
VSASTGETLIRRQYIVAFSLDRDIYALPLLSVVKIVESSTVASIPDHGGCAAKVGMINGYGVNVPAIDLHQHLGKLPRAIKPHSPVLLVRLDQQLVGLIVDEVTDVLGIEAATDLGQEGTWEETTVETRRGTALLLNLNQLFTQEQVVRVKQTAAALLTAHFA